MKQERVRRIMRFVEERGFYIILALCVTAIGISGYVLFFGGDGEDSLPVILDEPDPAAPVGGQDPMDTGEETPVVRPDLPGIPAEPQPDQPVMRPEKPARVSPVAGAAVQRPFSGDTLVYDSTMCDWRTHNGTDYEAGAGTPVLAVCDAVVGAVWIDGLRGDCIRLDCDDGTFVTYCGLAPNETVSAGMKVEAGQEIGKAGNSMLTESRQEGHLHLEVIKNGRYQDPEKFLK
jgi:murein DD-endopeptidase MepM/ murein hydrolase activator NlpD